MEVREKLARQRMFPELGQKLSYSVLNPLHNIGILTSKDSKNQNLHDITGSTISRHQSSCDINDSSLSHHPSIHENMNTFEMEIMESKEDNRYLGIIMEQDEDLMQESDPTKLPQSFHDVVSPKSLSNKSVASKPLTQQEYLIVELIRLDLVSSDIIASILERYEQLREENSIPTTLKSLYRNT
jgi:hypothetical protein